LLNLFFQAQEEKCEVLAAILVPSRELVQQIAGVLKPLADQYNYNIVKLVGGGGAKATTDKPFKKQWYKI
jgi:superfamily II DNA/RNA helicase